MIQQWKRKHNKSDKTDSLLSLSINSTGDNNDDYRQQPFNQAKYIKVLNGRKTVFCSDNWS